MHLQFRDVLVLLVGAAAGAVGGGCGATRVPPRRLPSWVFASSRGDAAARPARPLPPPAPRGGVQGRSEASDFVVAALQGTGLRFGTDGTVPALWGYLRNSHTTLPAAAARRGDVLFFQTQAPPAPAPALAKACDLPDHVGIVWSVDDDGRIAFVEARDGQVKRSYVHPRRPQVRRDQMGRVLNTFLRPKRISDPTDRPNFAGEMVCAAARPRG